MNKKRIGAGVCFFGLILIVLTAGADAATIFSDGFESGGLGGWTLTVNDSCTNWGARTTFDSDHTARSGSWFAEVSPSCGPSWDPASRIEIGISTSNYENITFTYYRRLHGLDGSAPDCFRAKWYNGSQWSILEETCDSPVHDPSYIIGNFSLLSSASNNPNFKIRFECTALTATTEYCQVDDILLTGNQMDIIPPTFSNYIESPVNSSSYLPNQLYLFNVTITEANLNKVGIEFNGVNYTGANLTNISNVFSFNRSNLAAGIYPYYWWANDSNGNYNTSGMRYYTIAKASQTALLNINESSPIIYGIYINVTCNGELFRNNVDVTGEKSTAKLLGVGSYNYSCKLYEAQNYSYDDDNSTLVVNRATQLITPLLNGLNNNLIITYPQQINASYSGNNQTALSISINGSIVNIEENYTWGAGEWRVNYSAAENQNYSAYNGYLNLTINKAMGQVSLLLNGEGDNKTIQYPQQINASATTFYGTITLYRNGQEISSETHLNKTIGVNYYNYTAVSSGNQNYSSAFVTYWLNITKGVPIVTLLLNNQQDNISIIYLENINASAISSGGNVHLYRDSVLIDSENSQDKILGAGIYAYKANANGNENYTDNSVGIVYYLNISKANPNANMQIVINPSSNENYGTETRAIASETNTGDADLIYRFYRDSTLIASSSPWEQNWMTLGAGVYNYTYNTVGGQNYTNGSIKASLTVNKISNPITLLLNGQAYNLTVQEPQQLNASAFSASGVVSLFRNNTDVSSTNSLNVSLLSGVYEYFANSSGNQNYLANSTGIRLYVNITPAPDTTAPAILLFSPLEGNTYGSNESLQLNFSVIDVNLQACWYNIDYSENITISNCVNTTFNTSEGGHTLYLYSNDSAGNTGMGSVNFTISIGAPTISLISPANVYLNNETVSFVYTATDPNLNSCGLFGDFTGIFARNQTNSTIVSGEQSSFWLSLGEGSYIWGILCNDTQGNSAFAGNKTFYIDTTLPVISISEPSGTKSSRENIPLIFSVVEQNIQACWYNVYEGITLRITNTTVNCALGNSVFNLTADADYTLNLYANDSAGNVNFSSASFSVDTSTQPPAGSPGGGGGGGSSGGGIVPVAALPKNETRELKISFGEIGINAMKRGTSSTLEIEATNNERTFINNCRLEFDGAMKEWLSNSQSKNLGGGERFKFVADIKVPQDTGPGSYEAIVRLKCDEGMQSTTMKINAFRNSFETKMKDYKRTVDSLMVFFELEEFAQEEHNIKLEYELIDFEELVVSKDQREFVLGAGEKQDYTLEFKIPKDASGEYRLKLTLSDSKTANELDEKVILPSKSILGLAISESNMKTLSAFGMVVVSAILAFFIGKFIYSRLKIRKLGESIEHKRGRRFIKLDVKKV